MDNLNQLNDDELILEFDRMIANDELVNKDYFSALINQQGHAIYYEVNNIFSNEEKMKYKSKFQLRKSPPVLAVRDEFDNETIFYLTETLTDELLETLKEVKRAYHGFDTPIDKNRPDNFFKRIAYSIKKNPFKLLLPFIIFIAIMKQILF